MTVTPTNPVWLPTPHGGRLTDRLVAADQAEALAAQAVRMPAVSLNGRGLADLECLAVGAFSPLTGFLGAADHTSVVEHGPNLFRRDQALRRLCCQVRKVDPLGRALAGLDAWSTGLRRDGGPARAGTAKLEPDPANGGIVELNPLADWTREQVWAYAHANQVPIHPLYEQGYTSIGCAPCTRAVVPGEDERGGRWWWEAGRTRNAGCTTPTHRPASTRPWPSCAPRSPRAAGPDRQP